jgi:3-oxoadipate enol-lactonase
LVAERRRIFLESDPAGIIAACESLATLGLRPALAAVRIPVLTLVGALDEATPPVMLPEVPPDWRTPR